MRFRSVAVIVVSVLLGLLATPSLVLAAREPLLQKESKQEEWLITKEGEHPEPPPNGEIEGACGVAVSPLSGDLYVSDYYHRAIDSFNGAGGFTGRIRFPSADTVFAVRTDSACGLAFGPDGALYANEYHEGVLRVLPEPKSVIDADESTGVAVDGEGDVFVDDRTYIAEYAAPVVPGDAPARKIGLEDPESPNGLGLGDGYGLAVDAAGERVYVADAADDEIEVYEPSKDLLRPVARITGPGVLHFGPLDDAALAVDNSNTAGKGHLLVTVNLKPLFERPRAAVYEFGADGEYLGALPGRTYDFFGEALEGPVFGEPSGVTVDPASGRLYVTTGNSEVSNVFAFGPYESPSGSEESSNGPPGSFGGGLPLATRQRSEGMTGTPGASASVVEQRRGVRVSFDGKLTPHALPRHGTAPVGIAIEAKIGATGGEDPPQLRRITIAINRNGHFNSKGLPVCREDQIQPSTTENALAACRRSLVGEGQFSANVKLPQQSPFPSNGKVLAFNGRINGRPAILAHIYGTDPVPTSVVLPFLIRSGRGTYGTTLEAPLPQATGSWGYVTGLRMNLHRRFSYRGHSRSFLRAGCPAPAGFPSASFPLAKTSFAFADKLTLKAVLTRSCKARG